MKQIQLRPRDILNQSFTTYGVRAALDRYVTFAGNAGWSIRHKVQLYEAGAAAADENRLNADRRASFRQIYDSLISWWQVFRPLGATQCWSSDSIFDHLVASGSPLTRSAGLRASTVRHDSQVLLASLRQLRELKPNEYYPTMAVSKFAHFANPRLIPIYDKAIVWDVAFAVFRSAFDAFCESADLDSSAWGAGFLQDYVAWAGELVSRDSGLLPCFAEWMRTTACPLPPRVDDEIETYEAAAFEMILIGAAFLVRDQRKRN